MTPTFHRSRFLVCANRRIHIREWGNPDHDPVVIWHGVAGNGRDHESLAARLCRHYYVICPDSIGCGQSEWPQNTVKDLVMDFQLQIATELLLQLSITSLRWVGASRGGALGIRMAASDNGVHVTHLVLNDAGPELPTKFRAAVSRSMCSPLSAPTLADFEQHLRKHLSRDGLTLSDGQWQWLAQIWSRKTTHGDYTYHHAPTLVNQVLFDEKDFNLWESFDRITAKTLLIRGADSSVLSEEQARAMQERGPKCQLLLRDGGHISLFHTRKEQDAVARFLQ